MNEDFLHYIWRTKLFDQKNLRTDFGESLRVMGCGEHNTHAGPDFFNARIQLGDTIWAGNVEIHLKSSDWKKHKHDQDLSYNNIILHVVYEADELIFREGGKLIPTLTLKNRIDVSLWDRYQRLTKSPAKIACSNQTQGIESIKLSSWLDRMVTERLEQSASQIFNLLKQNNGDWEETFYQRLARNFGFRTNAVPFEMLARSLPLKILLQESGSQINIEALFFGQAGMLDLKERDLYAEALNKRYLALEKKYELKRMSPALWKFMRMHPPGFPSIRIAQFVALWNEKSSFFSQIIEARNLKEIKNLFEVCASKYWDTHFKFVERSEFSKKRIGEQSIHNLIINSIVPVLFAYGIHRGDQSMKDRALDFLEQIPAEENAIMRTWKSSGVEVRDAFSSQSLYYLNENYCSRKKCLLCGIGIELMKSTKQNEITIER